MLQAVHVQIGDRIEFSLGSDGARTAPAEGRVMDVDVLNPLKCTVQVSPFEPFRQVDLSQASYKIVYAAGDFTRLKPEMIGWQVEILLDDNAPRATAECGVIKQVDCDLNCALIAFDNGHKDWRDLNMNSFKVVGRSSKISSPTRSTSSKPQQIAIADIPRLRTESNPAVHAIPVALPLLEAHEFDWYTEGGHVELCDCKGCFHEGALLCSLRGKTLQLYNEKRQFFEIQMPKQSFKVIIHGLMALKSIPLGQAVEIYSPMHAEFRRGLVLKAAEMGRLTPIRFDDESLEWLDLTSQTFKLVFMAPDATPSSTSQSLDTIDPTGHTVHYDKNTDTGVANSHRNHDTAPVPTILMEAREESPSLSNQPPPQSTEQRHHHERTKQHTHKSTPHALPTLAVGHVVELWESTPKQFMKYRVTGVHNRGEPHTYDLELALGSSSGSSLSMAAARASDMEKQVTIDLSAVKSRIQLSCDDWGVFEPILRGYRVDVYDKVDRSVLSGKIIETSSAGDSVNGPRVHVKLKDGSKRWFDVKLTKIKLKLSGEPIVTKPGESVPHIAPAAESMWHRVDPPSVEENDPVASSEERKISILARQQSEKVRQEVTLSPQLARHASTPTMTAGSPPKESSSPSRIPSLDFSGLVRERAEPLVQLPASESAKAEVSDESERSTGSSGEALSDLLPAMDDLWLEEPTQIGTNVKMRYVHIGTGGITHEMPQWLNKVDETTGESYIVNTSTGVRFQAPGSSSSGTTTPQSSDRTPIVVTLPIGPLEAARVANQMSSASASIDLCAEAFGP